MEIKKVGLTCDMRVIAQVLGQRTYSSNVLQVAVKELHQNAFDACKPLKKGRIDIKLGEGTNPITESRGKYLLVTDDGIGMTPDTVMNVYLRMGGTLKEGLQDSEKSGGFGIAKIQYLTQSEGIEITSYRDGTKTSVVTNAEQLFTNETEITIQHVDHPNGTEVKVWYPDDMDIYWPYKTYPSHFNLDIPNTCYPEIEVYYQGDRVCLMDNSFTHTMHIDFEWGDVCVYYAPAKYSPKNCSTEAVVLSAGLYQFKHSFKDKDGHYLKFPVLLDIHPKVDAHALNYPINNSREGFSPTVRDDVSVIGKYVMDIQKVLNAKAIENSFASMGSLEYIKCDGENTRSILNASTHSMEYSEEFLEALAKAFCNCNTIYDTKDIVKESTVQSSSEIDCTQNLKFCNQTDGVYAEGEIIFSKVASAIADLVAKEKNSSLSVGIIINKTMRGCLLTTGEFQTLMVNPLHDTHNGNVWVDCIMEAVVHELAHQDTGCHGESHNSYMRQRRSKLIEDGRFYELEGKLQKIYRMHTDILANLQVEFDRASNKE